jgi:hypothetical protein
MTLRAHTTSLFLADTAQATLKSFALLTQLEHSGTSPARRALFVRFLALEQLSLNSWKLGQFLRVKIIG